MALIVALVVVAGGLLAAGVASAFTGGRQRLEDTLAPYTVGPVPEADARRSAPAAGGQLVESPLLQRAVAAVGEAAARRGILPLVETRLTEAHVPVRPNEAVFFYLAIVAAGAVAGGLLGSVIGLVVGIVVAAVVPVVVVNVLAARRRRAFAEQLPDMLQLLATTLRSGFSVLQGLDTVARQIPDPMGEELRTVVAEVRLGRPVADSLGDVAKRIHSTDFEWAVTAIAIQREVGGNLAELLDIVADTMNARSRIRREARVLTAEGRLGAGILAVLPPAMALYMYLVNRSYIATLVHDGAGRIFLIGAIVLAVIGILWMRKLVEIDI